MENNLKYRSTIKSRPYFYNETKSLSELILQGLNDLEIREKVIKDNILQLNSEARKREVASTILKRLEVLDEYLIKNLIHGDVETSKIIVLYSILKTDRLFFEFMNEVFRDKSSYQEMVITDHDFYSFFESKRQQSDIVAKWVDYTFYKLQQVYIRILFEAGLLKSQKGDREINYPIIDPDVIDHIKAIGDSKYIEAIIGG
ncbi:MAG: DUF1819 family protein [Bacteroidales bacterium]|nr:DUF1819 family protein [Bacteroidales bacterium]